MKVFAIVIKDHKLSEHAYEVLKKSSNDVGNDFEIERFDAVTPDTVEGVMLENGLMWNYPDSGSKFDVHSGLLKSAYGGKHKRRYACAMSHYLLWLECKKSNEPILILEHDAIFKHELKYDSIVDSNYDVIGINEPRGNTRLAQKFHSMVQVYGAANVVDCPMIDNIKVPQGLAGASAYIMKPAGATNVIHATIEYGLWPNDAILCNQLIPNLGVTKRYFTDTQKIPSTTFTNA